MSCTKQTACLRSCAKSNARLHLCGVLRLPATERPVFLLHLDKIDEDVLRPEIQALLQPRRNGLVEGAFLINGSAFVERHLNDHAILRSLDTQIIGIDNEIVAGMFRDDLETIVLWDFEGPDHGVIDDLPDGLAVFHRFALSEFNASE